MVLALKIAKCLSFRDLARGLLNPRIAHGERKIRLFTGASVVNKKSAIFRPVWKTASTFKQLPTASLRWNYPDQVQRVVFKTLSKPPLAIFIIR